MKETPRRIHSISVDAASSASEAVATHASGSATSSTSPAATATTSATSAKPLTQVNLTAATPKSKAAAIADVLQEGAQRELAIVGQNLPPNSAHNSYEVWLYNPPGDAYSLGFVNPGVTRTGRFEAATALPTDVARYRELIVTLETAVKPKRPGPIVLQGRITGLS